MLDEMLNIAAECIKHPNRPSYWSPTLQKYVCPELPKAEAFDQQEAATGQGRLDNVPTPRIDPQFKLVFITASIGTLLFTAICVTCYMLTKGSPPPALEKFIQGLFDLAKIGFGAIVGLLGGKTLSSETQIKADRP